MNTDSRIRRLESLLGVSPDSKCQGDPSLCGCVKEECILENSTLRQTYASLKEISEHLDLFREVVVEVFAVYPEMRARVMLRVSQRQLQEDIQQLEQHILNLEPGSRLRQSMVERCSQKKAELEVITEKLNEVQTS